jgi:hypothetical protein
VVDARQANARVVIRAGTTQLLQGVVEVEKNRTPGLIPDHALHPEECSQPHASRDRHDTMDGAPAVEDHVTGRQFHPLFVALLTDHEFAAVVLRGVGQKKGCGKIGTDPKRGARYGRTAPSICRP